MSSNYCTQCQGKNILFEDTAEVKGKYRYYTRVIFCGDCRFILETKHWSEEIQYPKKDKDW